MIRKRVWATGKERFPLVLGTDGAGVVAALGPRVRGFEVGDRVWAYQ
jgi:NADPH:quinone reductase-like Zn-dependent oxidoreductase